MRGSIMQVFRACAAASGARFVEPTHGSLTFCCFHENRDTPAMSISDSKGVYHCFGCSASGGLVQAVVAFGLAKDHTEASHWLADRNLIPPSEPSLSSKERRPYVPLVIYTDHESLTLEQRVERALAHWAIEDVVGSVRLRAGIDFIARWRYEIQVQVDAFARRVVGLMLAEPVKLTGCCPHSIVYREECRECERPDFRVVGVQETRTVA